MWDGNGRNEFGGVVSVVPSVNLSHAMLMPLRHPWWRMAESSKKGTIVLLGGCHRDFL
jgi:hypothetical protein